MKRIRVFEHQSIRKGQSIDGVLLNDRHWMLFERLSHQLKVRCFQIEGDRIRFYSYVGALQLGDLTVEILPKLDRSAKSTKVSSWQSVLLDMLSESGWMKVENIAGASLKLKANSLLQYFISLFLGEIKNSVIPGGWPLEYQRQVAKRVNLKGQFLWARQMREFPALSPPYWQAHDSLSNRHWINHLLYEALESISRLNVKEKIRKEARYLQSYFSKGQEHKKGIANQRILPRRFQHCERAVRLAEMIYKGSSPDVQQGSLHTFALIFDMNRLFEAFILRQLRKQGSADLRVHTQTSTAFWQERQLRPDILIQTEKESIVLDTKWKLLDGRKPSMEDLRQVYVYAQYFDAKKVILLYPHFQGATSTGLIPFHDAPLSKEGIRCQILMLDLFSPMGGLRRNVGEELVQTISE
jgi:5-methylcytosine-specific restriction enzyme subunit McrC